MWRRGLARASLSRSRRTSAIPCFCSFGRTGAPIARTKFPSLQKLIADYGPKGLVVVAPTQHYGYVAGGADYHAGTQET